MRTLTTSSTIVAETLQLQAPCVGHTQTGRREHDEKVFGYPQHVAMFFRFGKATL